MEKDENVSRRNSFSTVNIINSSSSFCNANNKDKTRLNCLGYNFPHEAQITTQSNASRQP
ncbi:hypothetical protein T4B_13926 [Trichinella pseudospiralis]|uniref:Uncharacterized protein n=1 Tax=Trichinella pseudospiralis TaxID=6337 RepID=A0A0V1IKC7_TRIPS|nr:hypothetical protein T4A_3162 [Trichinella pseudospiralis]KRZ23069.1 hypothetical protein T4B_13926 [Trichinella pseudospiralis]KRZ36739.1 hypothetical protein T4C_1207 [Trichinella pseudospiralis]